jgi:hypothetical protein
VSQRGVGVVEGGDVGGDLDHEAVGGGRRCGGFGDERLGAAALRGGAVEVVGERLGGGIDDDGARGAVDDEDRPVGDGQHILAGRHDRGDAERSGEDGGVRDGAPEGGDDALHVGGVETRRLDRGEVGGHHDALGGSDAGFDAQDVGQHLVADAADVGSSGLLVGVGKGPEAVGQVVDGVAPCAICGGTVVGDELPCDPDEVVVVEEQQVGIEDGGIVLADGSGHLVASIDEILARAGDGGGQPVSLEVGVAGRAVVQAEGGRCERELRADTDAGGCRHGTGKRRSGHSGGGRRRRPDLFVEVATDDGGDRGEHLARLATGGGHLDVMASQRAEGG